MSETTRKLRKFGEGCEGHKLIDWYHMYLGMELAADAIEAVEVQVAEAAKRHEDLAAWCAETEARVAALEPKPAMALSAGPPEGGFRVGDRVMALDIPSNREFRGLLGTIVPCEYRPQMDRLVAVALDKDPEGLKVRTSWPVCELALVSRPGPKPAPSAVTAPRGFREGDIVRIKRTADGHEGWHGQEGPLVRDGIGLCPKLRFKGIGEPLVVAFHPHEYDLVRAAAAPEAPAEDAGLVERLARIIVDTPCAANHEGQCIPPGAPVDDCDRANARAVLSDLTAESRLCAPGEVARLKDELDEANGARFLNANAVRLQKARAESAEKERDEARAAWAEGAAALVEGQKRLEAELVVARAQLSERVIAPDRCPLTGLPFFMAIDGIATYGGPYDSYTIPTRDDDETYTRSHYDHDEGGWSEDERIGLTVLSEEAEEARGEAIARADAADARCRELEGFLRDFLHTTSGKKSLDGAPLSRLESAAQALLSPPTSPEATPVEDIVATIAATVPGEHVASLHGSQEIAALRADRDEAVKRADRHSEWWREAIRRHANLHAAATDDIHVHLGDASLAAESGCALEGIAALRARVETAEKDRNDVWKREQTLIDELHDAGGALDDAGVRRHEDDEIASGIEKLAKDRDELLDQWTKVGNLFWPHREPDDGWSADEIADEVKALRAERDEAVRGRLAAEASIAAKRTALTEKDAALRLAAVRLDAMAWVWCGGGCDSVFIKPENKPLRPLTFEMVREAARGVERLLAHYAMRTVRRLEPTEEPDETRRAIWAATAAAATAAQSIRDSETRVAELEAVERAAREYREKATFCLHSPDCTIQDEEERDALELALDAALAATEVPRG